MFNRLQKKWKVSSGQLLLILVTFAVGGTLTGYVGKKIMSSTGIENSGIYFLVYILLITFIWPFMVLVISIPMGQFRFFKRYISKLGRRIGLGKSSQSSDIITQPVGHISEIVNADGGRKSYSEGKKGSKHIVILASGAGSNALKIIEHFRNSKDAAVALIVCNKPGAGIVGIAESEGINVLMIEKERFLRGDGYLPELIKVQGDLLVLAGFLLKIPAVLINAFPKRIINIHPALLPKYGGKGMYGSFVHEAVVEAGELQSGITIHYVDEHYDNGDILFQAACPVLEGDTPNDLALRIRNMEHMHYPIVVEQVLKCLD